MTIKEAYQILGLPPGTGLREIKKKYRKLIMQIHPDVNTSVKMKYAYNIHEINKAYSVLKEKLSSVTHTGTGYHTDRQPHNRQNSAWNAPLNPNARTEREILQYAEDSDGTVFGHFCIARGKYMWTTDEDFSLFLLSLYQCSKRLLDNADTLLRRKEPPVNRQHFQAELAYLLAQQFIAQTALLEELTKEEAADPEGNRIFYIPSMLEVSGRNVSLKAGSHLYPSRIRRHRLYLQDQTGRESGCLSFPDDRLYYVIIPLFEQKCVQIKVQVSEKQPQKYHAKYLNLHIWLKLCGRKGKQTPENLNLQIEQLLAQYNHA